MIKKDPFDLQETDKLLGMYRGVVEDNNDPDKMGRCKIRVFGIHTENKKTEDLDGIPTDHLPWSEPALSLFEGGVTGFGNFVVPLQGSHVFVFFEQGHILRPIYFASIPGYPTDQYHGYKSGDGFSDPDENYPNKTTETPHKPNALDEPDYHRLARNEGISDTIVQSKTDNLDQSVEQANGGTWDEPDPYYAAEYPYNKVLSTHSGITIEIDDTDGEERIHIYHPSNSYLEINKDGNVIVKNNENKYEIVMKTRNQHVVEDENKTIDGDRTKQVGSDQYEYVSGSEYREVSSDAHETIGGSESTEVGGDSNQTVGGNKVETISINLDESVGGAYTLSVGGACQITSAGPCSVFSTASIACDAPIINFNSGVASPASAGSASSPTKPK